MLQVRRVPIILLIACFALLSSGVMEWVHNLEHAREDAAASSAAPAEAGRAERGERHVHAHGHGGHAHHDHAGAAHGERVPAAPPHRHHDANNCAEHAQLHIPLLSAGPVPLLVCLGLFVAFLTQITSSPVSRAIPSRIRCRGPPAR